MTKGIDYKKEKCEALTSHDSHAAASRRCIHVYESRS